MAKLVDILARELKVWPDRFLVYSPVGFCQCEDGALVGFDDPSSVELRPDGWFIPQDHVRQCTGARVKELAEDHATAVVTREQWKVAVDARNLILNCQEVGRVKREMPAWNGEGLPPVGTVCEASVSGMDNWFSCEVVVHHPKQIGVAGVHDLVGDALLWTENFRPIRTAEQIEAEEREKAVLEIGHILMENRAAWTEYYQASLIYDAGYRKQATPCGS